MGHAHLEQMDSEDSAAMQACGWDDVFWQEVGLGDLVEGRYTKIGRWASVTLLWEGLKV